MTETVDAQTYRAMVSGRKPKASGRPLTPAARKVSEATVETFRNDRDATPPFRAIEGHPQAVEVEVPVRIVSVLNLHETHFVRARRVKSERATVTQVLEQTPARKAALRELARYPLTITLTRLAPRRIRDEHENLRAGFKAVADAIAAALGIDDGDSRLTWLYAQEISKRYSCLIQIRRTV